MPSSPNKLSQLWQELKRRNVVRVVTVYAGAAFVIIELINNITEPLRLPEWTPTLVIVLLAMGFPIVVIFSWIYDVRPEGGIVKTEPVDKDKTGAIPKSSNRWKIASYISFAVIVGLIVLNMVPRTGRSKAGRILDKSIAVLPFDNLSSDQENTYFIDGMMESILDNLCRFKDLRVHSRTSTQKYKDTDKAIPVIACAMNVGYVLEGSGQKMGNRVLLTVQLIDGITDHHIWSRQYDREIRRVEELIDIQIEVARLVAKEIEAVITPEELEMIESIPTSNMAAYDHYQRAENEIMDITLNPVNASRYNIIQEALARAREQYNLAIAADPDFAEAYVGLGKVHYYHYTISGYLSDADLNSVLYYAERALAYNDRLASAYSLKGEYYFKSGNINRAKEAFEVAKELNPNDVEVYRNLGQLYGYIDGALSIFNFHKASTLVSGDQREAIMRDIVFRYASLGLFEQANKIAENTLRMDGDSTFYIRSQATIEMCKGNYEKWLEWQLKLHRYNPQVPLSLTGIARDYSYLHRYAEALPYAEQYLEQEEMTNWNEYTGRHHMALIYWHNGFKEKAEKLVHDQIAYQLELIEQGGVEEKYGQAYFDLFLCYAFLGDKTEAYENLNLFINKSSARWAQFLTYLKDDPKVDNLRDDEEYQQIVRQYETEFQAESERIKQWLGENDML